MAHRRGVVLALLCLLAISSWLPGPVRAATLLSQSRTLSVATTALTIGYDCFENTTPSCPVQISSVPASFVSTAPDFAPFTDTLLTSIGYVGHSSSLTPTSIDLEATLMLQGQGVFVCGGEPPACPHLAVLQYRSGSGSTWTNVVFELDQETTVVVHGSVSFTSSTVDFFTPLPLGLLSIELGPDGGTPVLYLLEQLPSPPSSLDVPIDHEVVLPAGVHRLQVGLAGSVAASLYPGAAGAIGSDVSADLDLQVTVGTSPLPSPAASAAGRLGVGFAIVAATVVARRRKGLAPPVGNATRASP